MNGAAYIVSSAGWFLAGGGAGYVLHDITRRLRGRQVPAKDHDEGNDVSHHPRAR